MVCHELLTTNGRKQHTCFSDGATVTVDFDADSFKILDPKNKNCKSRFEQKTR